MPAPAAVPAVLGTLKMLGRVVAREATRRAGGWLLRHTRGCMAGVACLLLALVTLCAAIAAPLQVSTVAWPVPIPEPGAEMDGWTAGGWRVSSGFGWRARVADPSLQEFHDGLDITGPTFCLHCPVMSIADARVSYIGWDPGRDRTNPPHTTSGGMIVELDTGPRSADDRYVPPELRATYAHLAPYKVFVQLQGRVDDPWDQEQYRPYRDYAEIGTGELLPAISDAEVTVTCSAARQSRVPEFVPERLGPGTLVFTYDKPIVAPDACEVSFGWPLRGGDWGGWTADEPASDVDGRVVLGWNTPIDEGVSARNVALRFRAHLLAPPPPPTPVPEASPLPSPPPGMLETYGGIAAPSVDATENGAAKATSATPACARRARRVRCSWSVAAIPAAPAVWSGGGAASFSATAPALLGPAGVAQPTAPALGTTAAAPVIPSGDTAAAARNWCANDALVRVDARAPLPCLTPDTAAAWQRARSAITAALGMDWLAAYPSDLMRDPTFVPQQDNQILYSWHKAGRAVDVPQHGPGVRHVPEGAYERLYVGNVDITAIMEREGFRRIPSEPSRPEWWHYEFKGGMTWSCAMRQIYAIDELKRWFPELRRSWDDPNCQEPDDGDDGPPHACLPGGVGNGLDAAMAFIAGPGARLNGRFNDTRVINGRPTRHGGIDIAVPEGRAIHAYWGGTVLNNAYSSVGGNFIIVESGDGRRTYYGHLQQRSSLPIGAAVARGAVLGAVGQTGMATGPHIHFQLSDHTGTWIDPEPVLAGGTVPSPSCEPFPEEELPGRQPCQEGAPAYGSAVSDMPGCGPPLHWTTAVKMLDHVIGHVDLTGATTGPHLHLGLKIRNGLAYNAGGSRSTNVCVDPWTPPALRDVPPDERQSWVYTHWGTQCWTDAADPLDFLPRAHASAPLPAATAAPLDGEPYQLPPPGTQDALLNPVPAAEGAPGEYWSPYADGGRFGGGGILEWLRSAICSFLSWLGLPCSASP